MISVIIPAFNSEKSLSKCLDSLDQQDYGKPFEIIVVDDGSSDDTVNVAKTFKKVKTIKQSHGGPAKARNTGAKIAKGNIVLFTDADCVADKGWLSEMVKPFDNNDIVGVQGRYKTKQKGIIPVFTQLEIEQRYANMKRASYIDFVGSYSAAYRRSIFIRFSGFDESFPKASGEDPELSFRMAREGHKMVFNPNAVVYHTHPTSLRKYLRTKYLRGYWGRLLYKKHPEKRSQGSGKGLGFFFGVSLTGMLILLLLLSYTLEYAFFGEYYFSLIIFLLLVGIIINESLNFMIKDKRFIIAGPIIVFLRNVSIGLGIANSLIKVR